jgi:hypothetical protein
LVKDASTTAMGAVLKQRVQDVWQHLAFSRNQSPAQQKYSAYDREIPGIYEPLNYFCHKMGSGILPS